jgi:hypothetical protein
MLYRGYLLSYTFLWIIKEKVYKSKIYFFFYWNGKNISVVVKKCAKCKCIHKFKKILFREAGLGWGWGMGGLNLFDTCLSNYCEAYSKPA